MTNEQTTTTDADDLTLTGPAADKRERARRKPRIVPAHRHDGRIVASYERLIGFEFPNGTRGTISLVYRGKDLAGEIEIHVGSGAIKVGLGDADHWHHLQQLQREAAHVPRG